MAKTISEILKYSSGNSGGAWAARESGHTLYLYSKSSANWACYSFTYTPTTGNKAASITFSCSVARHAWASHWMYADLYNSQFPSSGKTPIASATFDLTCPGNGTYVGATFTFTIPSNVTISSTTNLSVRVYTEYDSSYYLGWNGTAVINETSAHKPVNIGNGATYDKYVIYIADTVTTEATTVPVSVSNIGARGLVYQSGTPSVVSGWDAIQCQVGYYNEWNSYAMQLRFRLNRACNSIKLVVQGNSGSGGTYYCSLSDKEWDEELITRFFTQGENEDDIPVMISWNGDSYWGTVTINGDFPADKDLYIYIHNYATWYNTRSLYGLYSSSWYSKVMEGEAVENVTEKAVFNVYAPYIGDGTNWVPYGG